MSSAHYYKGMTPVSSELEERIRESQEIRIKFYLDKIYHMGKIDDEEYKGSLDLIYTGSERDLVVVASIIEAKLDKNIFGDFAKVLEEVAADDYREKQRIQKAIQNIRGGGMLYSDPTKTIRKSSL